MSLLIAKVIDTVAILLILGTITDTIDQKPSVTQFSRWCSSLSEKAIKQHLKLCSGTRNSLKALRIKKRDVHKTPSVPTATTNTYPTTVTTSQRPLISYLRVCDKLPLDSQNGYSASGNGIPLKVTFSKDYDWWKANVSWNPPLPDKSKGKCIGYRIGWYRHTDDVFGEDYCDKIMNENITSYIVDSTKGWNDDGEYALHVAVSLLPMKSATYRLTYRKFPILDDPITTEMPSSTPTPTKVTTYTVHSQTQSTAAVINSRYSNGSEAHSQTQSTAAVINSRDSKGSEAGVAKLSVAPVSKLVLVSTATGAGIVVLVIVLAVWIVRKQRMRSTFIVNDANDNNNNESGKDNTLYKGPHYISYHTDSKTSDAVLKIVSWLEKQNRVGVIWDKHVVVTNPRAWRDQQLALAKKVIMLVTPAYLNFCKTDQQPKLDSINDELTCDEICKILHKLMENQCHSRFVVVLVETERNEFPAWMHALKSYKYKNGAIDEDILKVL